MLVHYDGSRVKLAAEYAPKEIENSTQQQMQPLNQQAKPMLPKNNQPAAGQQQAAPAMQPMTPKIHNPTLARMGIQMPEPKPPTVTTAKLAQAIQDFRRRAAGQRIDPTSYDYDPLLVQTLKTRDYYDSPYLSDVDSADLKLRAPQQTQYAEYDKNLRSGTGAAILGSIPLLAGGLSPAGILGSVALGTTGFLAGRLSAKNDAAKRLRDYRYFLQTQN